MRILVTGATGFIGRHLVARLRQDGYIVRALAHNPGGPTTCPEEVESVVGDVCDAQAMKTVTAGCNVVHHLAGKVRALLVVVLYAGRPNERSLHLKPTPRTEGWQSWEVSLWG